MPISALRFLAAVAACATLSCFLLPPATAQEQLTPPSETAYGRAPRPAPVGHRQPRAADIPQTDKTPAELLNERQQAELNGRLRICRGC